MTISPTAPTQVRRPWRATTRTVLAATIALAAMLPLIVDASGLDGTAAPVAGALAIAGAITRVMALPSVEVFLRRFLPWLAADPGSMPEPARHREPDPIRLDDHRDDATLPQTARDDPNLPT